MISLIDLQVGNINSFCQILDKLKINYKKTYLKNDIEKSEKIILPGVSNFEHYMKKIHEKDLFETIKSQVIEGNKPILGICSGMQVFGNKSEEGEINGFGFINADVKKFKSDFQTRIPHMGWNKIQHNDIDIFDNISLNDRFYFCHSYYMPLRFNQKNIKIAKTFYGEQFCSAFKYNNIYGLQFHPEKSQDIGFRILENFLKKVNNEVN